MAHIESDGSTVVLHTARTTYALRLEGSVMALHWGDRLSLADAAALPSWRSPFGDTFEGPIDGASDFPTSGFVPPAFSSPLAVEGHEIHDDTLIIRLGPVDLHYRVRPGTDVIERWSVVHGPAAFTDHAAAVWCLPQLEDYRLSHVTGGWAREGTLRRTPLPVAETTLVSRRGVTSHASNPWVMLDDGTATEQSGPVWSAALAFSGSWRITVTRTDAGRCSLLGAAGHAAAGTRLDEGEELVSPVFAGLYAADGFGGASRAWHEYQNRYVRPHAGETRPVLYNSWEATAFDVTEEGQCGLAEIAAKLGVELFVVDDGWFGARTSDRAGLGDWHPNPSRFPSGLRPLADHVRSLGMEFGLWVEPEMVNPDSDLFREHPDWVLHRGPATSLRHQLVLDFTRDDVREWALAWLDELVRSAGLAFLKWDFNRPFTEARPESWVGHAIGVYEVIDRLRARHPGLRIEACAGGGGRVDLGMLARTDQAWTSDNTDALDRIKIQSGYTQTYAPGSMVAWVTDSPNPITGRRVPLPFRFHVAMAGVLGIGGDLSRWTPSELDLAIALIGEYREFRDVVQHGSLHRLRPADAGLSAWQYNLGGRTVVFAWRVSGADNAPLRLRGLDPGGSYADKSGRLFSGAALMAAGLPVDLPFRGEPVSEIVQLTAQGDPFTEQESGVSDPSARSK
ncbi:alpha-galactosidase [Actinoplanes sp. CA-142083]|uniref:alpha-galactosidase n=1 Tax=Actinoplanes sp. CA-142083 TaxID=3239903 RepID=UPI003D9033DC